MKLKQLRLEEAINLLKACKYEAFDIDKAIRGFELQLKDRDETSA